VRERNACFHSFFHHSLHYHSFFSLRSFFSLHSIPFHIFQGNVVKWKKKNVVRWMVCGVLFLFQLNARFIPFHCRLIKRNNTTQHRIRLLSPGDYRGSCGKWSMNGRRTNEARIPSSFRSSLHQPHGQAWICMLCSYYLLLFGLILQPMASLLLFLIHIVVSNF